LRSIAGRYEVVGISPKKKTVELKNHATGAVTTESYDKLVLSPGAAPIRPPLPGIDLPGIFSVRTVPDAREIREWIERGSSDLPEEHTSSGFRPLEKPKRAVVVGGGYIGLEMAENLVHRGFEVTLVEMLDQVMAPLDPECARVVERHLEKNGVRLALSDAVAGFKQTANGSLEVLTKSGKAHPADIVILAIGVRPETALAKMAGIEIGERGGIRVDEQMRTSNPDIFAVGDAVEVKDFITGEWSLIPLAGPANRQGRIAADVIAGETPVPRPGHLGPRGLQHGATRAPTKKRSPGRPKGFEKSISSRTHAGYRAPNRSQGHLPEIRRTSAGARRRQVGVEKRSALAMAISGRDGYDLEEAELCYAPQFGSAKDPVNFAGMVAADVLRGDMPLAHWGASNGAFLLDVRQPVELVVESVPDAVNIPLGQLRTRLGELPRDREIHVICRSAQRAYYATRILLQNGFKARNLSGGMLSRAMLKAQ
jgi:rhodanese-related sulfurtransferase